MRTSALLLGTILIAALSSGCADKYDKAQAERVALLQELNKALDGVTDETSLDAALPELQALNDRIKANTDQQKMIGEPSAERAKELKAKYADKLKKESEIFGAQMLRIARIKGKDRLLSAIKDVNAES
jgi:hypothetical protein